MQANTGFICVPASFIISEGVDRFFQRSEVMDREIDQPPNPRSGDEVGLILTILELGEVQRNRVQ